MKKHTLKNLMQEHSSQYIESPMTQEEIEKIIKMSKDSEVLEVENGYILFKYLGMRMELYSDEEHNRMRFITPITRYSSLAPKNQRFSYEFKFSSSSGCSLWRFGGYFICSLYASSFITR